MVEDGRVLTNKKRFGIFSYVDTLATFHAHISLKGAPLPKMSIARLSDQKLLAPVDFESPYDIKRYPEYFNPEYVDYFFACEVMIKVHFTLSFHSFISYHVLAYIHDIRKL